jgi:hypothetical protein
MDPCNNLHITKFSFWLPIILQSMPHKHLFKRLYGFKMSPGIFCLSFIFSFMYCWATAAHNLNTISNLFSPTCMNWKLMLLNKYWQIQINYLKIKILDQIYIFAGDCIKFLVWVNDPSVFACSKATGWSRDGKTLRKKNSKREKKLWKVIKFWSKTKKLSQWLQIVIQFYTGNTELCRNSRYKKGLKGSEPTSRFKLLRTFETP